MSRTRSSMTSVPQTPTCRFCFSTASHGFVHISTMKENQNCQNPPPFARTAASHRASWTRGAQRSLPRPPLDILQKPPPNTPTRPNTTAPGRTLPLRTSLLPPAPSSPSPAPRRRRPPPLLLLRAPSFSCSLPSAAASLSTPPSPSSPSPSLLCCHGLL
jgi:hypothetical protein